MIAATPLNSEWPILSSSVNPAISQKNSPSVSTISKKTQDSVPPRWESSIHRITCGMDSSSPTRLYMLSTKDSHGEEKTGKLSAVMPVS